MSLNPSERKRSPRFPSYPIRDAIVYAEKIYDGAHRSSIDTQTAFRLMGFAGKSGASATALGAVRQFGLVEGTGGATRISQLALRIFEPASPREQAEAIVEAARKPEVFKAILNRFDDEIPSADEAIRAFLIRDLGFSKVGAEECLESLRQTLQSIRENAAAGEASESGTKDPFARPTLVVAQSQTQEAIPEELIRIPLTKECSVELRFSGSVSTKALANLIRHIELMKEAWSED